MLADAKRRTVCFDIGNVLVKLGPPVESWLEPRDALKLRSLIHDYSVGNLGANSFFHNLRAISKHPAGAIPIEEWFVEKRLIGVFPGATALLSTLTQRGVEILLFSNTNEAHWNQIQTYSFEHSHAFVSFRLKKAKPDPNAFKEVERSTGLHGKEIIFFDDSLTNIEVARRLGWKGHVATGTNPIDGITKILRSSYQINI